MATDAKAALHELVDRLPDDPQVLDRVREAVARELAPDEADPVLRAFLDAPEDDEPLTEADRVAIAEGRADVARGDVVAWEDYDPDRRRGR